MAAPENTVAFKAVWTITETYYEQVRAVTPMTQASPADSGYIAEAPAEYLSQGADGWWLFDDSSLESDTTAHIAVVAQDFVQTGTNWTLLVEIDGSSAEGASLTVDTGGSCQLIGTSGANSVAFPFGATSARITLASGPDVAGADYLVRMALAMGAEGKGTARIRLSLYEGRYTGRYSGYVEEG